jgi:hypothetical protein
MAYIKKDYKRKTKCKRCNGYIRKPIRYIEINFLMPEGENGGRQRECRWVYHRQCFEEETGLPVIWKRFEKKLN